MAKKPQSFIPSKGTTFRPTVERKRAQLEHAREQFRAQGYEAELNIEALKVQIVEADADEEADDSIPRQITRLENTRDNAYRSARRMDELLSQLPAPKAKAS